MKKHLISILAILLVSVFILSSCDILGLGGSDDAFIEYLQGQIDKLEEELSNAENENKEKDKEIADLKEQLEAAQDKLDEVEEKNKKLEDENKNLESENDANDQEIADLKEQLEAAQDKLDEVEEENKKLEDENKNLESENDANDQEIADLKEQIQDLLNDKDYTVTFDINGGVGEIESQTVRYKKTVNEPIAPTKEYYDFAGWYVNGEKVEFPYTVTADTDFVAHYTPTKYTITYNVNGGTMPEGYVTEYNVETGVTLPTPTRSLYLFDGWYEDAKFDGAKVTSISVGEYGNKTYYAKWVSTTDGITYQLANNGTTYTVTGYEGKDTVVVIPGSVDGIPVNAIANNAFKDKQRITSITVPDSVTAIGTYAFYGCISLTELNLGNGIKRIPDYMAYGCNKLQSILIPYSVTTIGDDAFCNCSSLVSVNIPNRVTTIGYAAFYNCSSLVSVTIPDSVTYIDSSAFYGCSSLVSVVIPDSVTSIGYGTFRSCSSLVSVVIPDSVTSIGSSAFSNCYSLTSVVIPDSVTSIGQSAFYYCSSLVSVTIPDSVTSIGSEAFYWCDSLYVVYNNSDLLIEIGTTNNGYLAYYAKILVDNGETIYANDGYNYTLTDDGFLFREKDSKYELIAYIGGEDTVTLPENINGNSYDLYYMRGVVNVTIPEGFTTINDYAFNGCDSLVSVTIPDSVTIGNYAFYDCDSLTDVVIGDRITYIGSQAFYSCSSLTSVVIGDSVTSIGDYAFYNCSSLTEVYYNGTEAEWNSISISNSNNPLKNATRYYYSETEPTTSGNFWHWVDGEVVIWPDYVEPELISTPDEYFEFTLREDGTYSIKAKNVNNMPSEVVIPSTYNGKVVTAIDSYAFVQCLALTEIIFPDSITTIGDYAFKYCICLNEIMIPESVIFIGDYAFANCDSLTKIEVDKNNEYYKSIDGNLYSKDGKKIIQYSIGKKDDLFEIPLGVTIIGKGAFSGCEYIDGISIPNSVTNIGDEAFSGCCSLSGVELGDVIIIGCEAFSGCINMRSVGIGNSVTTIGSGAFVGCDSLSEIYYDGTEDEWNRIFIYYDNDDFENADRYYYG